MKPLLTISALLVLGVTAFNLASTGQPTIADVAQLQDAYYQQYGEYMQIRPDGLTRDGYTTEETFGVTIPYRVDVYKTPEGQTGYVIVDVQNMEAHGYGPKAQETTYLQPAQSMNLLTTSTSTDI